MTTEKVEKRQSFFELLQDAQAMLMDRDPLERDLIYFIAALDDEARSAIILAYRSIQGFEE